MKAKLIGAGLVALIGSLGVSQAAGLACLPATGVAALHATRMIHQIAKEQLKHTAVARERYLSRERTCNSSEKQWMRLEVERLEWVNFRLRAAGNAKGCGRLLIPLIGIFLAWGYRGPSDKREHLENTKAIEALRAVL